MNITTEIIALVVRALSEKTDLVAKPDTFTEIFATISTGKTYDVRTAESIEEAAQKIAQAAKNMNTRRKFKKIVNNV